MSVNINNGRFNDIAGSYYNNNVYITTETDPEKLMKWLNPPNPSTNHNNARDKHHENTGQWLLGDERYVTWKQQANSFMWINGISGCGKTVICSTIIEDIKAIVQSKLDIGLAFFYFDISDEAKQTSKSLLSSLSWSLTVQSQNYLSMKRLYGKCKVYDPTKDEILGLLKELLNSFTQAYVIVDALDECGEYDYLFMKVIKVIHGWQLSHLHFLVTSRREQHILLTLSEAITTEICLSADLVESDIISYINVAVGEDSRTKRWGDTIQKKIKEALINGANGMFRWVACQIEELRLCPNQRMLMDALKGLPKDLEATYDQILERINEMDMSYVTILLHWLVFGMRPLTLNELATVVTFDPMAGSFDSHLELFQPDDVMLLCSSLVMKAQDNTIILAHASVKEYFLAKTSGWQHEGVMLPKPWTGHALLTYCCVTYLLQNGCHFNDTKFPFVKYAIQFWLDHYKLSNKNSILHDTVMAFFDIENPSFESWVWLHPEVLRAQDHDGETWLPLHYAIYFGLEDVIKTSTIHDQYLTDYSTSLCIAAAKGYTDIVKLLINKVLEGHVNGGTYASFSKATTVKDPREILKLLMERGPTNTYRMKYDNPLQAASLEGQIEIVKLLLEMGADVNAQSGRETNALQAASVEGHTEIVKLLLSKGTDVNIHCGLYGSALQAASFRGHTDIVKFLLYKGANVNSKGGEYGSALHAASLEGHTEIVKLLLEVGADVKIQGGEYADTLQAASFKGSTDIVRLLLGKAADVNFQGGLYGNALQAASVEGHIEIVKLLLEMGADVNSQGGIYGNALQAASSGGHAEIVNIILHKGADVDIQGGEYGNALQAASAEGHIEIVKLLLEMGAKVNINGGGETNALQAAALEGHTEIVKLLLDNGADVNFHGGLYDTALQAASLDGAVETVNILLHEGANVNSQGGEYGNALQAASVEGHIEIVKHLLGMGAKVNINGGGETNALQAAALEGHTEIVKLLLDNKADVNFSGGLYGNALQAASFKGCTEIVNILLSRGADVNAQGGIYGNALWAASLAGHIEVVKLFLAMGAGGLYANAFQTASFTEVPSEIVRLLLKNGTILAPEYTKTGIDNDWYAIFNHNIKRVLDVQLLHNLVHDNHVYCVRFSFDGKYLAMGYNRTVQIYDTKTGVKTSTLTDGLARKTGLLYTDIQSICFSPDGKMLATGGYDNRIRIWDIAKKQILRTLYDGHQQRVNSLAFSLDGHLVVSGSSDETIRIWDVVNAEAPQKVLTTNAIDSPNNDGGVRPVAISPSGQFVASGAIDDVIQMWDVETGVLVERLQGHKGSVSSIAFTPDGKGLVSGSADKTLKFWDVSGLSISNGNGKDGPGGSSVSAPSPGMPGQGTVVKNGEKVSLCTMDFIGHKDYVSSVAVSHDGQQVVSGSYDGVIRFWDARTAEVQCVLQGHEVPVTSIDLSPVGGFVAAASIVKQARIWSYGPLQL